MVFVAVMPASAAGYVDSNYDGKVIEVVQGGTFVLRTGLVWDEPDYSGYYGITIIWEDNNRADENFTVLYARAFIDNDNDNLPGPSPIWLENFTELLFGSGTNGKRWTFKVYNTTGDPTDGYFDVEIYMQAASRGTPHRAPWDNHSINKAGWGGSIDWAESTIGSRTPAVTTIRVLEAPAGGVDVSISPSYQSGLPGAVINYIVTVKNTGTLGSDNYNLSKGDNTGWGDNVWLDNYRLENIPQGENRTTTLRVRIPENATGCTEDNIWVKATSQGDNTKSDNESCIAHVTIVRGVQVVISPLSQENENGGTLTYTVTVKNTGNVQENFQLARGDNAGWALALDNNWLLVPKGENRTTKLTVNIPSNATGCTWDNIWVKATSKDNAAIFDNKSCLAHVRVVRGVDVSIAPSYQSGLPGAMLDYNVTVANLGNTEDTYDLIASDDAGWSPSVSPTSLAVPPWENRTTTLSVTVPLDAIGCTNDDIIVTAISWADNTVDDNDNCVAHATIVRVVDVMISPSYQSGAQGSALSYTVNVINIGNVVDDYVLTVGDNENWGPTLDDNLFENVAPGDNKETTLRVTVPENAVPCTRDNIVVTAAGTGVTDSDSCIAHAALPLGVEVSISPDEQSSTPGSTLNYTVTVKNTGALDDNYNLTVSDNENWGPAVSPTSLTVPAGENRTSTLSVTIPENALGCTRDNIVVTATSQTDNMVSASDTCVAHAAGLLTEIRTVIYPTADVYAFGEYGTGYSRTQLKFDTSGIPLQGRILSAKLWLYRLAADGWDGGVALNRVDDQLWSENIIASQFDAQTLTNEENQAGKFTSRGWDYLDVPSQLNVDYVAGNTYASFRLRWANDDGSEPSIGIDDGRFLVINSENDELAIFFSSSEYDGSDPYLEVVYVPPYAVSVSISPSWKSGLPTEVLSYTVTVRNTGNLDDNYILTVSDNSGWGPVVSPTSLTVASGSAGEATLTVTIPENAAPCTMDNIIVTATSTGNPAISASASCIAHQLKANFSLATLYKVSLDFDAYLGEGSKLVAKFYKYDNTYQAENIVWSGTTPAHVAFMDNIPHPLGDAVERVTLFLTDNEGNVISTLASFTVTRGDLWNRLMEIRRTWPYATLPERDALWTELIGIRRQWPYAPL